MNFYTLFSLLILLLAYCVTYVKSQSPQSWVYSSEYDANLPKSEEQGMHNNIKIAKTANLIFLAAGNTGIKVIDPNQNYAVTCVFRSDTYIQGFAVTKDGNYVFLQNQGYLTVYSFSNRSSFVKIGQDTTSTIQHIDILINHAETIVYILQANGVIRAINISNKSSPTFAGTVTWFSSQIFGGTISPDDQWVLAGYGFKGLVAYKMTYNANGSVTFTQAGSFQGSLGSSNAVEMTSDMHYVISIDNRKGINIGDFTQITGSAGVNNAATFLTTPWWPSQITLPAPFSLCISADNNFVFIGVLATGIFVIDITTKASPILYQEIIVPFQGESVKLSLDESVLYYANAESFLSFPKVKPNLNDQYLNFFNGHLSAGYAWSNTYYYWRCEIDDANNLYYGAFDDDGLWIVDITDPQSMVVKQKQLRPPSSIGDVDIFIFVNGYTNIIVPTLDGTNVIAVYDTSQLVSSGASAHLIQLIPYATTNYIVDFDTDSSEKMIIGALGNSVIFFDTTTVGAYSIKTVWSFTTGMKGTATGVMLTNDDKYVIGACRGYGYFILDVSNINNIIMEQYIDSLGAETLQTSSISNNYGFFIDGLQGIMIVDFTKLPTVSFLSQIQVNGWSNDITFLNNEKLMLVSTLEQGMVTMIDISNLMNPYIVTTYQYEGQNGMSTCALANESYLFINNNIGVRALPTISPVQMHVEVVEVLGFSDIINDYVYSKQSIYTEFSVGMTVQVDIVFLYQPMDLIVDSVYLYQLQAMQPIPSWITYDPLNVSFTVNVVKEAIDPTNMDFPLLNVLVLKTLNPLYQTDFNYNSASCPTTAIQNQNIYTYMLANGYVNDANTVDPKLSFTTQQEIIVFPSSTTAFNTCISNLIKQTLLNSIQYAPIYLQMKSSLIYTPQPSDQMTYISTVVSQVTVSINIPKFSGEFIYQNQVGVNIQLNLEKNSLILIGSVENMNNYLAQGIILYAMPNVIYSTIMANLTISDNMNYDILKNLPVTQIFFISQKQDIQQNPSSQLVLQTQLNSQYSSGDIQILTDFLFTFDEGTFVSPDVNIVTYSAFILSGGKFVPIDTQFWIQFYAPGYKFYGSPPETAFESSITIKVTGDDGYQQYSDTFVITVNQLPALFVIQWIAQVIGPLIGALGMYKYRSIFYNAFFKRRVRYSKICAQVNERFVYKIPLITTDIHQAIDMIQNLLDRINKEEGGGNQKKTDLLKIAKMNNLKLDTVENEEAIRKEEEKQEREALRIEDIEEGANSQKEKLEENSQRSDKQEQQQQQPNKQHLKQLSHHTYNTDKKDVTNLFIDKIQVAQTNPRSTLAEKKYLSEEGKVNMKLIVQDMLNYNITFKIQGKQLETKAYKEELENNKSGLYKSVKLLFYRYFLTIDTKTHLVSEYLKYYGKQNSFLFTQNDWYKQFVDIVSDDKLDKLGHTIIFPKVSLKPESISIVLQNIQVITSKLEGLNYLSSKGINPYFIKYNLIADALGVDFDDQSSLFPSHGESIHLKSSDFRSVESFKYAPGGSCFSLKKFLNMEYDPYGPKENMQFPNWLQLIMQSGVIILTGIPQQQDMEEVLIRFYGLQGYIYRSFTLRVQDQEGNSSRSQAVSQAKQHSKKKSRNQLEESSQSLNQNTNSPLPKPLEGSKDNFDSGIEMDFMPQQQGRRSYFGRSSEPTNNKPQTSTLLKDTTIQNQPQDNIDQLINEILSE